jgi:hypothetical protein
MKKQLSIPLSNKRIQQFEQVSAFTIVFIRYAKKIITLTRIGDFPVNLSILFRERVLSRDFIVKRKNWQRHFN